MGIPMETFGHKLIFPALFALCSSGVPTAPLADKEYVYIPRFGTGNSLGLPSVLYHSKVSDSNPPSTMDIQDTINKLNSNTDFGENETGGQEFKDQESEDISTDPLELLKLKSWTGRWRLKKDAREGRI